MKLSLRQIDVSHRLLTVRKMSIGEGVAGGAGEGGWGGEEYEGGWVGGGV